MLLFLGIRWGFIPNAMRCAAVLLGDFTAMCHVLTVLGVRLVEAVLLSVFWLLLLCAMLL